MVFFPKKLLVKSQVLVRDSKVWGVCWVGGDSSDQAMHGFGMA